MIQYLDISARNGWMSLEEYHLRVLLSLIPQVHLHLVLRATFEQRTLIELISD